MLHAYSDLATQVVANATALRQLIAELMAEQNRLGSSVNQTTSLMEAAEDSFEQVS